MSKYEDLLEKGKEEVPEDIGSGDRFEIPEIITRKEGSQTRIEDFKDLVEKFNRDEKHVSNYIQNELGTVGHIEGNELVLNGEFRRGKVNEKINNYADEYLYCPECERPDTEIRKEKGVEILRCQACGARTPI